MSEKADYIKAQINVIDIKKKLSQATPNTDEYRKLQNDLFEAELKEKLAKEHLPEDE